MNRTMLDGVNAPNVRAAVSSEDARIVAGYVNGMWSDFNQLSADTPGLLHLSISVRTADLADVLDIERGDANPSDAPGWVTRARAAGLAPWTYQNASTWPAVRDAFHTANVEEPFYWVAEYDDDPTIPEGAVAKQYRSTLNYDVSSVIPYIPGFDPEPVPLQFDMVEDMQQIDPLTAHPNEYAFGVNPKAGCTGVQFGIDGYGAAVDLRVVIWDAETCHVREFTFGGPGSAPKDHQYVLEFPDAPTTYQVTVSRTDRTQIPISVLMV